MIVYRLVCANGHEFEGWFASSSAFDGQAAAGVLGCPSCGDAAVSKAIMAPAVSSATKARGQAEVLPPSDADKQRKFAAGFRKYVEDNADYVGGKFPEEARKIHYGESEERHIYGESTLKEARDLIEEGIAVAPLPPKAGELN